ncbi:MAG: toll/interleukin-1 receptor domain-containing protein, partial [Azoarcus sp.]|nr:toll/interleukin-1 receptor domain-containing protein [Azoarcus sp.]
MGSDARVFINYRGPDHEQVKRLAKILKRQGLDIFLDSEDIRPGQPEVLAKLTAEIRNSDVFLACIGPAGIPPQTWQTWEQSIVAQLKARTDSRRIIVVYLPGAEIDENDP